mgnify:CR=1 FL=1
MYLYQKLTLVSLCFTLVVLSGCSSAKSKAAHSKKNIEDFDRFYDKFHQDGAFQMSRLKFPLQGHDGVGNKWTKTNWTLMKGRIYEVDKSQYKVEYKKTDKSFFQKVWIENSGFNSECRFELIDNKWYLVYALEIDN